MKRGYLSEYFDGVAAKRLSAVEADVLRSNQHEFNGVEGLRQILGEPIGKVPYETTLLYLNDEDEPLTETATLTWYDARQKAREERGVQRWEYRLYFPTSTVSLKSKAGDLLVIAKTRAGALMVVIAEDASSISRQLVWLFGLGDLMQSGFLVKDELSTEQDRIEFASQFILESIGVVVEATEDEFLEEMLRRFSGRFPPTREFSEYARSTLPGVEGRGNPDAALMAWMEREETLFRTLERHLISERISRGFQDSQGHTDVDGFLSFSLSVQNRRKSRVGLALENHLEDVFKQNSLNYSRTCVTENRSKPDFIFPGAGNYHDPTFPAESLTMLGVKSTCKDRWRQVLSEADRIEGKHLLTLEAAISHSQTAEMRSKSLQLVVPQKLHSTYTHEQQTWLLNLDDFIGIAAYKQSASS